MVKSSRKEIKTHNINTKKLKKRVTSLEKIKIVKGIGESSSMGGRKSSRPDFNDSQDEHEYHDHSEVIQEVNEHLEGTGTQPYQEYKPVKKQ